jgi:hypothetical protein
MIATIRARTEIPALIRFGVIARSKESGMIGYRWARIEWPAPAEVGRSPGIRWRKARNG